MANDALMPRFLYTMLKQLDLKGIDWNLVSRELNITNGHAARMRYSRFKQQMEGKVTTPRRSKPSTGKSRAKKGAGDSKTEGSNDPFTDDKSNVKLEDGAGSTAATPASDRLSQMDISRDGGSPGVEQMSPTHKPNQAATVGIETDRAAGTRRIIKSEPQDDNAAMHGSFTPPAPDSQETDADADADADASFELLDMQTNSAHTEGLLDNHSSNNVASFTTSGHHSFGNPSQESMMSFSSSGTGAGMYSYMHPHSHAHSLSHSQSQTRSPPGPSLMSHSHTNLQNQNQDHVNIVGEHPEYGLWMPVIMPYDDARMSSGPATGIGGMGLQTSNAEAYPQGGMARPQHRQGLKLEERWDDSYCS